MFQYGVKLGRRAPVTDRFHLVDVELGGGSVQELSRGGVYVCLCVCVRVHMSRSVGGHQLQFEIQLLHMPVRPPDHIFFFWETHFFFATQFAGWDDSSLPLTDFNIGHRPDVTIVVSIYTWCMQPYFFATLLSR